METTFIAPLLGLAGGLIAGSLSAWVTLKAKRLDHVVERDKLWTTTYEKSLFDVRLEEYRSLWALTEATSRRNVANLSPESAQGLAEEMTRWYYQKGGILLTSAAREAFFNARASLDTFNPKHALKVAEAFSTLRTALCDDLNSRAGPGMKAANALPPDVYRP